MAIYSNTLAVIRKYLSSVIGDLIEGTANSGTTTTLVSTLLRQANDYYNHHKYRCYIYDGTNIGVEREVSDWDLGTHTLTFDPAFPSAINNTSKYELHYIFTEEEYRKAINLAIECQANKYFVEIKDETTVLVADTYEYALPTSMLGIIHIITEKTKDGGIFDASDEIDRRSWSIIKSYPPKLKLHEDYYSISAGKDLRIEGCGSQPLVDDDTDVIYLPPDWLIQKAITFLPQSKAQRGSLDETYRRALLISAREPISRADPRTRWVIE